MKNIFSVFIKSKSEIYIMKNFAFFRHKGMWVKKSLNMLFYVYNKSYSKLCIDYFCCWMTVYSSIKLHFVECFIVTLVPRNSHQKMKWNCICLTQFEFHGLYLFVMIQIYESCRLVEFNLRRGKNEPCRTYYVVKCGW